MIRALKHITGIDLSIFNKSFADKTINGRMGETNCNSFDEYTEYLRNNSNETGTLKKALNNNFSEFFRNTLTFAFLEQKILPALAVSKSKKRNGEIRIWSAACAAGQEAYSIAMLCDEFSKTQNSGSRFRIFATDMSETEIQKAEKGVYPEDALKNVSYSRIKNYFSKKGDSFIVHQQLKEHIDFSTFDLLSKECSCPPASIFGNFDIVFCANLLFYYNPKVQKLILDKVDSCLANNGYLIVGEAERDFLLKYNYKEGFPQSGIFQKMERR